MDSLILFILFIIVIFFFFLLPASIGRGLLDGGLNKFCWKNDGPRTVFDFFIFSHPLYWLTRLLQTRVR